MGLVKTAYDISRKQVFYCRANDTLAEVARKLHKNNVGSILVKGNGDSIGLITVNDMLRHMHKNMDTLAYRAKDIMSSPLITVSRDIEIDNLVEMFNKHKVSRMVLKDNDGCICGVVRDIAVYKYMTFFKYDKQIGKMFARDHLHKLY